MANHCSIGLRSGRQVQQTGAGVLDRRSDALEPVGSPIIQDDDVALLELGNEELFDPSAEALAVDRAVERARRDETVLPQRADEGGQSWPQESEQVDKWIFCLTPARLAEDQELR